MRLHHLLPVSIIILLLASSSCFAHFGMVIPSKTIVTSNADKSITFSLSFSHPFEGIGMKLERPEEFYLINKEKKEDLTNSLEPTTVMGHGAWQTTWDVKRPGVYQVVMVPTPYWEPAEDLFIIHYTKTMLAAFGADTGWDKPVGLPTEIVPLLRPFGNYGGNSFVGQVLVNDSPVASAEVEVEYYNSDSSRQAVSDYHITQVIKTDPNGIFTFTCPNQGWWGFAALNTADYQLKDPQGKEKDVEIGAVLWIYMD